MLHGRLLVTCFLVSGISTALGATGDKAKAKCLEYAKAVYTEEVSPIMSAKALTNKVSQCGILETPLIVGGVEAKAKEFPHMAVIGYGKSPDAKLAWHCGGALISENYVLTAAHCVESGSEGPAQKVRFGELNFEMNDETEIQDRGIVSILSHPEYKPPAKYNDIALIKLTEPVEFNGFVRPACLNLDINIGASKVIASGFGKLEWDAEGGSSKLMKVLIKLIDEDQCTTAYKQEIKSHALNDGIKDSVICAGEMEGGKDTCQGDSGGPLQIVLKEPECMYSLIGVTSFGKFCGFKNSPAIYSRVSSFIDWIEKTVWP